MAADYSSALFPEDVTERDSLDTAVEAIEQEETRAWEHLEKLTALKISLQEKQEQVARENEQILARIAGFGAELSQIEPGSPAVENLWWQVNAVIRKDRERLGKHLDAWGAPTKIPTFSSTLLLDSMAIPQLEDSLSELRELFATIGQEEKNLRNRYLDLQRQKILFEGKRLMRARGLSVAVLKRTAIGGWAGVYEDLRNGSPQIVEGGKLIVLLARFHTWQRIDELKNYLTGSGIIFFMGKNFFRLLKVAMVILFLRFCLGLFQQLIRQKKNYNPAEQWESGPLPMRRVTWLSMMEEAAPWAFFLTGVWGIQYLLSGLAGWAEFNFLIMVGFLYGAYRLSSNVLAEVVVQGGRLFHLKLSQEEKALVAGSVRTIMRTVFLIVVLLSFAKGLVSNGLLYKILIYLGSIILLGITFNVFRRWRSQIVATYLKVFPSGPFAGRFHHKPNGLLATLATPFLFLVLILLSVLVVVLGGLNRFERSRKLITFLSRKRIERQAESKGLTEGELGKLPESVLQVFGARKISPAILVDNFPGREDLAKALENWQKGSINGSFLLTGERGSGKWCWIRNAALPDVETIRIILQKRILTAADFTAYLTPILLPGREQSASLAEIREALLSGPRRLIVMEFCQNLFLATVGGYEVFEAFLSLVEETSMRVFWLCTMNRSAWAHLEAVRGNLSPFRWIRLLERWSPGDLLAMLHKRADASGVRFDFQDLQMESLSKILFGQGNELTEEDFVMMLWDYTNGNPALAVHFFLRSLTPAGPASVRVRLFKTPDGEELRTFGEVAPLLAALVRHGSLTLEEAFAVCRYSLDDCLTYLDRLHELGITEEENGRHQITLFWYPEVRRYLKRKNLLTE